ncbi:ThiF family adenylyltransferase [Flavobacterium phragmitis]|uniref:ThiF family protein n=1 Tax=Flavobacterium phragmitis TaxID=739143 RepID=A0A1I1KNV7_9FLAO|nr:ThiF family adenylyltransferase [Flavobacterium phragmitis]SFC59813.1 ThiF family protein [Flavobacterium phragmitis]
MLQPQINLSLDLKKLRDEGYELEINGGYVCAHHIPYVNEKKEIGFGVLICPLNLASEFQTSRPPDHTMFFMGEVPCHKDGKRMDEILNSSPNQMLLEGIVGNHLFSSKPSKGNYDDYYEKFTKYVQIISVPAKSLDSSVTATTFKPFVGNQTTSVFNYFDTNSSRANIMKLNEKFGGQKIAIIGLGGTGSYILDQVAKNHVDEIHLFDADDFSQHNAFRSPGAPSLDELNDMKKKAVYFSEIYSKMHKGIVPHIEYVTRDNIHLLEEMSFVFICIDNNSAKKLIVKELTKLKISFIDVGLGVQLVDDKLIGIVRTTVGTAGKNDHLLKRIPFEEAVVNEYVTNIQIADLNALNAILAVIKWKKISGFYQDLVEEFHSTYSINVAELTNGDYQI